MKDKIAKMLKEAGPYVGIAAIAYAIYAISMTIKNSHASRVHVIVAGLALLAWLFWTIVTIDERTKEKQRNELVFRYSRITDGFPEEFETFCKERNIGATEAFAKAAIRKEMYRIIVEERKDRD